MFDDLFNFSKKRTLKQSIGFFIVHGSIVVAAMTVLEALGA